jgi:hypothetical protein
LIHESNAGTLHEVTSTGISVGNGITRGSGAKSSLTAVHASENKKSPGKME